MHDHNAILDDLLARWHAWGKHYNPVRGYPSADCACREARISRQYDYENGAMDAEVDNFIMKAIDFQVSEMADPHRACIYILARNCYTGREVRLSNRVPSDKQQRVNLAIEARNLLLKRLISSGVI